MERMMRVLKTSLIMLALVVFVYASVALVHNNSKSKVSEKKTKAESQSSFAMDEVFNLDDLLKTVDASSLQLPVTDGKANYQPVVASSSLVDESQPTQANASTDTNASSKNTFDEKRYPFRAMLGDKEQAAYNQVCEAISNVADSVKFNKELDVDGVKQVMQAVFNDHPEFFWIETSYVYGYTSKGTVVSVALKYNELANNLSDAKIKFNAAANRIINHASTYGSKLEQEKYVYEELQKNCEYHENSAINQSAYSCIVNGSSVCAGYARAFQYIMMQLDIPCYICTGTTSNGNHAWNIIEIDNNFYNVDLSWDDSLGETIGNYSYTYFNISDKAIGLDHTRGDMSVNLPSCNSTLR